MHLEIVKHRNKFFIFSGILVLVSLLGLFIWKLKPGIDFKGGSFLEVAVTSQNKIEAQDLSVKIQEQMPDIGEVRVQPTEVGFILRTKSLSEEEHQKVLSSLKEIHSLGTEDSVIVEEKRFESVGPMVGKELKNKSVWALILASLAIILYIAWSFRKISKPVASWKYGMGAVIALLHDLIIVTGVFAILGHFLNYEIDLLFITALLTILGFSVHDTIVVYDRTRENLIRNPQKTFEETVNKAINETLHRSISTSLTVFMVLLALYLLGGDSTKNFVLALLIGVVFGTYSSIFIASTLLIVWQKIGKKK
ncbi:MAG TPA: protein translocase subunit SecF [bacterium]|nr:protein translocase subunit SecF [bacterium]